MHLVTNRRKLGKPVYVETAHGRVTVTEMGDLPGYSGLMKRCLLMPESTASLLPVKTVCKELGAGFEIKEGSLEAAFIKYGQTILKLEDLGSLHVLNSDSKIQKIKDREHSSTLSSAHLVGALEQELGEDLIELHLALVSARCEGLGNNPNRASSNSNSNSLSLLRSPHQGQGGCCSSTGESGLMSHGGNSNSLSDGAGEKVCNSNSNTGGIMSHNSITGALEEPRITIDCHDSGERASHDSD
jgi:hypothetical protein